MNITIQCLQCEAEADRGNGDGWAFDNVPDTTSTRTIIAKHENKYEHKVQVLKS